VLLDRPARSFLLPASGHPFERVHASGRLRKVRDAECQDYGYRDNLILHHASSIGWIDFNRS